MNTHFQHCTVLRDNMVYTSRTNTVCPKSCTIKYFYINNDSNDYKQSEPQENYHPTLHFPSALQIVLVSFSQLFWFYGLQLHCLVQSRPFHQPCFHSRHLLYAQQKKSPDKPTVHCLLSIKRQTGSTVSIQLVKVEHLAAKDHGIFLRRKLK